MEQPEQDEQTEQTEDEQSILSDPTFVQRIMADNDVLSSWVIGILEGCEECTDNAAKWVEGQRALRQHHEQMQGHEGQS